MGQITKATEIIEEKGWHIEHKSHQKGSFNKLQVHFKIDCEYPQIPNDYFSNWVKEVKSIVDVKVIYEIGKLLHIECREEDILRVLFNMPLFPEPLTPPNPTGGMKVDFNNLRKKACYTHDRLVELLNRSIIRDTQYASPNDVRPKGREIDIQGYVLVDADELKDILYNLRQEIGSIAMVYEPGDESFADVYPKDKSMEVFNPEDGE